MTTTTCASCDAAIIWCQTTIGGSVPIDADPVDDGDFIIGDERPDRRGVLMPVAMVLGASDVPAEGVTRHRSHFRTCPVMQGWQR